MGVLTYDEYNEKEKKNDNKLVEEVKTSSTNIKEKVPVIEYKLFYPDNPKDNYFSGLYKVELEGDQVAELEIKNGVIVTTNKEVKECLISQGFILIKQGVQHG